MPTRQSAISHAIANAASRRLLRKNRKDVPIRLAESVEDMTSAFKRLHNQYKLKGYQEQNEHGQRVIPANLLPTSYTFLSEDQGTTNGTVTLIEDGVAGLPADEMYKEELDSLRAAGRRVVEFGALAMTSTSRAGCETLIALFRHPFILSRDILKADDLCITVNPRHEAYYRRFLGFEKIGDVRKCQKVSGAPAVLLRLDLRNSEDDYSRKRASLYRFFCDEPRRTRIRTEIQNAIWRRRDLFSAEYLDYVSNISDVLAGLSRREWDAIASVYGLAVELTA